MQLRRDTDYACRIAFCVAQRVRRESRQPYVSILELCRETGIPRRSTERICGELLNGQILEKMPSEEETLLMPGSRWETASLLDLIRVTEKSADLFAVFDKRQKAFRENERLFGAANSEVQRILSRLKIKDL